MDLHQQGNGTASMTSLCILGRWGLSHLLQGRRFYNLLCTLIIALNSIIQLCNFSEKECHDSWPSVVHSGLLVVHPYELLPGVSCSKHHQPLSNTFRACARPPPPPWPRPRAQAAKSTRHTSPAAPDSPSGPPRRSDACRDNSWPGRSSRPP